MTIHVDLTDAGVGVRLDGLDAVWSLRRSLTVAWADVVRARVVTTRDAKRRLRWRVGGTALPGVVLAGTMTVAGQKGVRELWATYRDREVLEIETRRERPRRVVLQVPDPTGLAAAINARVGPG
ncbi:MAG: hypothetical protein ACXVJS_06525 [Acidimicrobiia bacterium]